jgi:hypothetical protein
MALVKVRGLVPGTKDVDVVVVEVEGQDLRFSFNVSPVGTPDAAVVTTEVPDEHQAAFEAAVVARRDVVIQQNPNWDDVNTDSAGNGDSNPGDGINDGTKQNWTNDPSAPIYEIVP